MKTHLYLPFVFVVVLIGVQQCLPAQPLTWDKNYEFSECSGTNFTRILQLENSDLLIAAFASNGWGSYAPVYMRIDSNGNAVSKHLIVLPQSTQQCTHTLVKCAENTFFSFSFDPHIPIPIERKSILSEEINDSRLIKLNTNCDTLTSFQFDSIGWVNDMIYDNGLLIAVGSTNYVDNWETYYSKITVLVTDTLGNLVWRREYLTDLDGRANSILKQENGNYLITGSTAFEYDLYGQFFPDKMFILEVDSLGNLMWTYFSDIIYSQASKVIACSDGTFALIGDGYNPATNNGDLILWRMTAEKEIDQPKIYDLGSNVESFSIKQTIDEGFIVCGEIWAQTVPSNFVFFYMKLGSDMEEEWNIRNEGRNHCAEDVILNANNGYYFAGRGEAGKLVKTDLLGNGLILGMDDQQKPIHNNNRYSVFPNPGKTDIFITNNSPSEPVSFTLYNSLGKKIICKELKDEKSWIDASLLLPGLYFYQISNQTLIPESGIWIKH